MNYLLDTCVLSEFTRRQPDQRVGLWVDSVNEEKLFISVITIGEIQRGVEKLPASTRKKDLSLWLNNDLVERFHQRLVPLDAPTMFLWGSLMANMERAGQTMALMDSLIAATALSQNLVIATRKVSDFTTCGVQVINPWD